MLQEKDGMIDDLEFKLSKVKAEFEEHKEAVEPVMKPDELTPSLEPLDNLFPQDSQELNGFNYENLFDLMRRSTYSDAQKELESLLVTLQAPTPPTMHEDGTIPTEAEEAISSFQTGLAAKVKDLKERMTKDVLPAYF